MVLECFRLKTLWACAGSAFAAWIEDSDDEFECVSW